MSNGQIPAEQVAGLTAAIDAVVDALPAPDAADVTFTPASGVSSTDVQAAVVEVYAAIATQLAALVDSSPSTLDTLNELAAALGDDPDFAATITTLIGTKLASADFLATLTAALVAGDNVTITPVADTLVIDSTGGGGGPSSTFWEVVLVGSPPEPVTDVDDTDWLYVEVPA